MAYYLSSRYKRYDTGGKANAFTDAMDVSTGLFGITGSILGQNTNKWGRPSMASDALSKAGQFGKIGSAFGPWGTAIGAVIGAGAGIFGNAAQKRKEAGYEQQEQMYADQMQRQRSAALIAQNPSLVTGNQGAGYFAAGGLLSSNYLSKTMNPVGGSLKPMSNDSVEVEGPSHEQGGVELPGVGAEVEGKETMHNDFVFSHRLGFAAEHKKIAKAIGKIEAKGVMSPERVNAVERLRERQENLKLSQEYFKKMMM